MSKWYAKEKPHSYLAVSPAIPVHECSPDQRFKRMGAIELVEATPAALAAPELLEALKAVLEHYSEAPSEITKRAELAIAKAEGRE